MKWKPRPGRKSRARRCGGGVQRVADAHSDTANCSIDEQGAATRSAANNRTVSEPSQ